MKSPISAWRSRSKPEQMAAALLSLSYLTYFPTAVFDASLPFSERALNLWVLSSLLALALIGLFRKSRLAWRSLLAYTVLVLLSQLMLVFEVKDTITAIYVLIAATVHVALLLALTRPDVIVRRKTPTAATDSNGEPATGNQVVKGVGTALIILSFVVFGAALRWLGMEQTANERNPALLGEILVTYSTIVTMLYVLPFSIVIALIGIYLRRRK